MGIRNITYCLLVLLGLQSGVIFGQPTSKNIDSKALGPDFERILNLRSELKDENLLALIAIPGNEQAPVDIFNDQFFYDKNEYANTFYYLPGSFNLLFNKRKGKYKIELTYPEDDTGLRKVSFKAKFGSNVDKNVEYLMERLLYQITKQPAVKVLPVVLEAPPKISFEFSEFNVLQESILVTNYTDYTEPMTVSWSVNQDDVEPFLASMANEISFDGTLSWQDETLNNPSININLSLLSTKTMGEFYYERPSDLLLRGFKNSTSFPLKLKSIKILNENKSGRLVFGVIQLINTVVESHTVFKDLPVNIQRQIRNYPPSQLLIDYEVLDCELCKTDAVFSILNQRASVLTDWIEVQDIGAYEFTKAKSIEIFVDKIYKTIDVEKNEVVKEAFKARRLLTGEFSFRYRVIITLPNGTIKKSRFIKNEKYETAVLLNKDFIKKHFREYRK